MPTDVINSIGPGRDYPDPFAWEVATRGDLVAADERRIGEVYTASYAFSAVLAIGGANVDATRYRYLRAASGHEFDPDGRTGVFFTNDTSGAVIACNEGFLRIEHIGAQSLFTTASNFIVPTFVANAGGPGAEFLQCVAYGSPTYTGNAASGFRTVAASTIFRNCIAIGSGDAFGLTRGYYLDSGGINGLMQNCTAYRIQGASLGRGIEDHPSNATNLIRNGMFLENVADIVVSPAGTDLDYTISTDSSATGDNSQTGVTAAQAWVDAPGGNFDLALDSPAIDAGEDLSAQFTQSFVPGVPHGTGDDGAWETGGYPWVVVGGLAPILDPQTQPEVRDNVRLEKGVGFQCQLQTSRFDAPQPVRSNGPRPATRRPPPDPVTVFTCIPGYANNPNP